MSRDRDLSPLGPKSDAVTGARALLQAKERRIQRRFLVEGPGAVSAALDAGALRDLYTTDLADPLTSQAKAAGCRVYFVTEPALNALSETVSPRGPIGVAAIPEAELDEVLAGARAVLICDAVSDPGNLGTMVRTAAAAGFDAVITTNGSADPWSGKVVRSSVGTCFAIPIFAGLSLDLLQSSLRRYGIASYALAGEAAADLLSMGERLAAPHAWFVGSEAHGVSEGAKAGADLLVRIPMADGVESLNAGVAAAISMYETTRAQGRF